MFPGEGKRWGKGENAGKSGEKIIKKLRKILLTFLLMLKYSLEKKDHHIRVPAGFPGPGWVKLRSEKSLSLKAIGGHSVRAFPPGFGQSDTKLDVFSTGWETGGFTGFSGNGSGKRGMV
ncbi:MAG: hypothetical protein WC593_15230 [Methanoregula sp.]